MSCPLSDYCKTHARYAYFKKLTYFSTECIYSPDGELSCLLGQSSCTHVSVSRTRSRFPQRPRGGQAKRYRRYHPFWRELLTGTNGAKGHQSIASAPSTTILNVN